MKRFVFLVTVLIVGLFSVILDYYADPWAPKFTPVLYQGRVRPVGVIEENTEEYLRHLQPIDQTINIAEIAKMLQQDYQKQAGTPLITTGQKTLYYPSKLQLVIEYYSTSLPLLKIMTALYLISTALFFWKRNWSIPAALIAFTVQTALLLARCYILSRPPVSNMYETLLYVPWVSVAAALIMKKALKAPLILPAATMGAGTVLLIQQLTIRNNGMENVQAVLDSQFWLIIHVLMVVGSYALFITGGILGHIFLTRNIWNNRSLEQKITQLILQSIYVGSALLICGTILGGIWAAQSWGRFWDWDPKESWAFISCCIYLALIHAYRFGKIGPFGLALGSIIGLHAIIFTWYGVNYILGTGMHSYGFGNGGEKYYYLFLGADFILATALFLLHKIFYSHKITRFDKENLR